jgi:uncharacterized protein
MVAEPTPLSPCRQICRIGADGLCDGCGRTMAEITSWLWLPLSERQAVMSRVETWEPRT